MTEPNPATRRRTSLQRSFVALAVAATMAVSQPAQACRTGELLLETARQQDLAGAQKQAKLRVEQALIRKDGNPANHFAYRMLVVEGDGTLRTGDHIVVAAPNWGESCLFWIGEPDAKGIVEGYATVRDKAADQSYYWLSTPLGRTKANLETYKAHPDRFVWRRVRFTAPWKSAPSQ